MSGRSPRTRVVAIAFAMFGAGGPVATSARPLHQDLQPTTLVGYWTANLEHSGESSPIVLHFERASDGSLSVTFSTPAIHIQDAALGPVTIRGDQIEAGPLRLTYSRTAETLTGTVPAALVPVYKLAAVFHRASPFAPLPRSELSAPIAQPAWTFEVKAPIWTDATFADDTVFLGADSGSLYALAASSGHLKWRFETGAAIRAGATVVGDDVYVQADSGLLFKVNMRGGQERWHVRVAQNAVDRSSEATRSRYDDRASAAAVAAGKVYIGTDEGHVLALNGSTGAVLWDVKTDGPVTATPLVANNLAYVGSFDGNVYAFNAETGRTVWKVDTGAPVTTAAALFRNLVVVGSRSYDLLGLDALTGRRVWTRYYWYSWVESTPTVRGDVLYVGSSDAAKVFAFEAPTGNRVWELDAHGCAWGQPAVTDTRVYFGIVGVLNYLVPHEATVLAIERATGRAVWRYPVPPPSSREGVMTPWGFPGAAALGHGLVFLGGLDGRVYAFKQ